MATASKVIGILFLPAILLVGLLKIGFSRRLIFQSVLLGLAAAAAALATYVPLGSEAPSAIQYMLEKQSRHNARGHAVTINDVSYKYPPWWAYLWWQWKLYGTLASLSLGAAVIFAVLRRRTLEIYLLVAALVPFLVLSFYAQVKLSHYIDAWQPPLILLVALAVGKLARHRIAGGIVAVLLLAPFVYLGIHAVQAVSQVQPGPKAAVAEYLKGTGHDRGPVLVWGSGGLIKEYLPEAQVLKKPDDAQGEAIEAVIVDRSAAKRKPNRAVESYLATNRDRFESSNPVDKFEVYTRKSQQPSEDGE